MVPISTWSPWKPVATKNVDPYIESDMANEELQYSNNCRVVKNIPSSIVHVNLVMELFFLPVIMEWCVQVIVIPDLRSTSVFNSGIAMGFRASIPSGGQLDPISVVGTSLLWKKAQKKEKKNNTSEVMNSIMPCFKPVCTFIVCSPWNEDSRIMSRHQTIIIIVVNIIPVKASVGNEKWKYSILPIVKNRAEQPPIIGHGLASTKWYGWYFFI